MSSSSHPVHLVTPRQISYRRGVIGFRIMVFLLPALGVAAWLAIGAPVTVLDAVLVLILVGVAIVLMLRTRGNVTLVLDAGDALLVGRKRHVVLLSEITDFYYYSGPRPPYVEVTSPGYPGGKFSYTAIDQRHTVWGMGIPIPETVRDLAARIDNATPTPVSRIEAPARWNG